MNLELSGEMCTSRTLAESTVRFSMSSDVGNSSAPGFSCAPSSMKQPSPR